MPTATPQSAEMSPKYYVYLHVHPETKAVVYVGKGSGGRVKENNA
jgi:hypothetical protein